MVNLAKNILGTSSGGSSLLGSSVSTPLPNVHLKYTTPDVGLDHRILTARARFNGGSFYLDVSGHLVDVSESNRFVDRLAPVGFSITRGAK